MQYDSIDTIYTYIRKYVFHKYSVLGNAFAWKIDADDIVAQ